MLKNINATQKGLITAIIMIGLSLLFFYTLKQSVDNFYQYFIYVLFAAGIIWSVADFRKAATPQTKFKEYFSEGFKTFVVCTLLIVVYTGIFFYFNTAIRDEKIELNNELLIKQGNHTLAEIKDNARQMKKIFIPMAMGITVFRYLFLGSIITVITTFLLMQKEKKN